MKQFVRAAVLVLVAAVMIGCAAQPTQEIDAAKAAVQAIKDAGADMYAPEISAALDAELEAAMAEVTAQDGKLMKDYAKAKELLASVGTKAAAAQAEVDAAKQVVGVKAGEVKMAAEAAVAATAELLAKVPASKEPQEDVEALKASVAELQAQAASMQGMLDAGDFAAVISKAESLQASATAANDEINAAIAKYAPAKKSSKKK